MAYNKAYGHVHQVVRRQLMDKLRKNPGQPCPACGKPMTADMAIDLGHATRADKAAGKPGSILVHARCNRGEHSEPPQVRARRLRLATAAPEPAPGECAHPGELHPGPPPGSCLCTRPVAHHAEIRKREQAEPAWHGPSHPSPACPGCGGWSNSRIW